MTAAWKKTLYIDPDHNPQTARERWAGRTEAGILICLMILTALLPYAGITASRELGQWAGILLLIIRMILLRRWDFVRTPLDIPLLVFFSVGVLSLATAVDAGYSAHELGDEMLRYILLYFLAVNGVRTESRAMAVIASMLAGVLVMDVYGLAHSLFIKEEYLLVSGGREAALHASSTELSTYLIQTTPFLAAALLYLRNNKARAGMAAFLMLHVLVTYLTYSRTAFLALGFEILLFVLILLRSWKISLTVFAGLVLLSGLLAVYSPRPLVYLQDPGDNPDLVRIGRVYVLGIKTRLNVWKAAWNHLEKHPFAGVGAGRRSLIKKYPESLKISQNLWHPHNTFINIAVEFGLQGLLVFLFILYRLFRYTMPERAPGRASFQGRVSQSVFLAAFVMTAGYFLKNMTDDLYVNDAALLFWLLTGVAFSLRCLPSKDRKHPV